MSYSETPSISAHDASMSRGTARSISSSGRPSRAPITSASSRSLEQEVRRRGRGDDDVGALERLGQLVEAGRSRRRSAGPARSRGPAGGSRRTRPRAAVGERPGGQLAGLAGADDHDLAAAQVAEPLAARAPPATAGMLSCRSPIAVSVRTRLPVASAARKRRLVSGPARLAARSLPRRRA